MSDPNVEYRPRYRWQGPLARFLRRPLVELSIGGLIVTSVGLTLIEFSQPSNDPPEWMPLLENINILITWVFIVELTLRFGAIMNLRRFFKEYWLDILAVLPALRAFRVFRALRLLRLLRLFRLIGIFQRATNYFPYLLKRGAVEFVMVFGLLLVTVMFGATAMLAFERGTVAGVEDPDALNGFERAFWFSIYTLIAGEPIPNSPRTMGGRIVSIFIMFMGLTIFAVFTGTVSAFMVDRLRTEGRVVEWETFADHVIICGWNSKAEIILLEYEAAQKNDDRPIVVIGEFEEEPSLSDPRLRKRVRFLHGDFTRVAALKLAGIERAHTCIILSDNTGNRSETDADARTILAALTVEKLNSSVYTCAELYNRDYGTHLEMGHVNDYVVSSEHSAFLLAQAALNKGLMGLFTELLTHQHGNQFYRFPVWGNWVGRQFFELFVELKEKNDAILVAVQDADGKFHVNPGDYVLSEDDCVIAIAQEKPQPNEA